MCCESHIRRIITFFKPSSLSQSEMWIVADMPGKPSYQLIVTKSNFSTQKEWSWGSSFIAQSSFELITRSKLLVEFLGTLVKCNSWYQELNAKYLKCRETIFFCSLPWELNSTNEFSFMQRFQMHGSHICTFFISWSRYLLPILPC